MTETTAPTRFEQWALLEIMGHQRYAGLVTEQTVGGSAFVRIDVPDFGPDRPAFTKLFGGSSIYAITPVTEQVARAVAESLRQTPVSIYDLPESLKEKLRQPALTHVPGDDGDFDEDEEYL